MNINIKHYLLLFFLGLSIGKLFAQETHFTDKYIQSYFNLNQEEYSKHLSDSVTWSDPTWNEIDQKSKPVSGKQQVLNHLRNVTLGLTDIKYVIEHQFQSADLYIFEGMFSYSWTDQNNKKFDFSIRDVTILKIKDNKIIEHTDYGDFKEWKKQYITQSK